jgi:hypothetical protein
LQLGTTGRLWGVVKRSGAAIMARCRRFVNRRGLRQKCHLQHP